MLVARVTAGALAVALVGGCSSSSRPVSPASGGARPSGAVSASPSGPSAPAALPADLAAPRTGRCTPDLRPGWLSRENARAGLRLAVPQDVPHATLYLGAVSAVCGDVVRAAVSAPRGDYRLRAVRTGWYRGVGGRVVAVSARFRAGIQRDTRGADRGGSPGWRTSAELRVDAGWLPGLYVVQLLAGDTVVSVAPLVVLAPAGAARSPEIFVVAAMTWTAYTTYGGRSLYGREGVAGRAGFDDRARVSSFARPLQASGFTKLFVESAPTVRAVERAGLDVDYAADVDVDRNPSLLRDRAAVLTGSHTEYVTRRIVDAFQAARDAGTNLAFLGGNQFYWQARITRGATGFPLSMTVYRRAGEDPLARSQPELATVRWRDRPVDRPEARLLGAQYAHLGVLVPLLVLAAPSWLGWTRGRLVPAGAASEVDAVVPGVSPRGTQVVAGGRAVTGGQQVLATVTYGVAPSGAAVFDAADVSLGCSTARTCDRFVVPLATADFWAGTVVHVVRAFARPRFGADHPPPSSDPLPSYRDLVRRFGTAGVGTAIGGGE